VEVMDTAYRLTGATAAACWRTPSQARPVLVALPRCAAVLD